ncbi:hypothetical protein WT14_32040 [Burkholderia stagnalis]|nr:hypothetical protein WT07_00150 [Burkholderia stagnalis]KVN53251.1 hypothetical protein WT14_32040 [Burkholderia stagnalis]KWE00243.1 hypothetical protein WT47_24315 [Burkholderia stagnalis]KWE07573.1 hypothetical protein WT48_27470 [Burkholderia stagnalis]KWO77968.1 hypothetical protein WU00_09495 [Burkholderia stagnalis]
MIASPTLPDRPSVTPLLLVVSLCVLLLVSVAESITTFAAVPVRFFPATRSLPVTCSVSPALTVRLPPIDPTVLALFVTDEA